MTPRCPICGTRDVAPLAPRTPDAPKSFYPFCSERCQLVDLDRWLTGKYAIPGDPPPDASVDSED